ncbi:MAG: UDP-4-amino-4,6-dideoxy-N-acetyl-beta-L-altrosamine transaminase [Deltaproteobacteria bacterium]|nr:UDP-4-amino-4,6-dideoxy-N-acetyl-beta-L-altrosamine transaminase [Deltaproteobacteria bacterium]
MPNDLIRYSSQSIDDDDIKEVIAALKSSHLAQGPRIAAFENAVSLFCSAPFAVACSSGTAALHIACMAAGVEPGDEVITSPITFVASANCAVYCGGKPVFADIDPATYNILPEEIAKKITAKTKAVIPVHFAGQSCDMEAIVNVVRNAEKKFGHKITIIEDASHALGSKYKKRAIGSCAFSDMTVLSFHPVKHITTGEGGMVLTADKNLGNRLKRFRSHGITSNAEELVCPEEAWDKSEAQPVLKTWYYEQNDLGYNYRITDIQSALGISQLKKLPKFVQRRREIVNLYNESFAGMKNVQIPFEKSFSESNFHLYVPQFDFEKMGVSRAHFMQELKNKNIQTQVHYVPVYTQPYYRKKFGTAWGDCPNAESYYQKCLSIPLYPAMTDEEARHVISAVKALARGKK